MNTFKKRIFQLLGSLAISTAVMGCSMTVQAVHPMPAVTVIGDATYAVDVSKVPDVVEPGRNVTLNEVKRSVLSGFENAMGDRFRQGDSDMKLVFDMFSASIDEGQIGVLRVTYKVRWLSADGKVVSQSSGTAIPVNPIQTGPGHWRDTLEVMFVQIVGALEKAQERQERARA